MVKLALRQFEDSLCRCGHSIKLAQAPDARLAYRASSTVCQACAAGEMAADTSKKRDAGAIVYVEDLRDTPGAMDPNADDVMFMPEPGQVPVGARYQPPPSGVAADGVQSAGGAGQVVRGGLESNSGVDRLIGALGGVAE